MNTIVSKLTKEKIAEAIFWFAFISEILLFALKKFNVTYPNQTLLLRGICFIFCIKILLTRYTRKEWGLIIICSLLGIAAYFLSGRGIDILFRAVVMIAASKNISREKAFKILFFILLVLYSVIMLQGIFGQRLLVDIRDYGRGKVEARYTIGFSHANIFHFSMWSLMMLFIYLYYTRLRLWHYTIFIVLNFFIAYLTRSRTSLALAMFSIAAYMLLRYTNIWNFKKWLCIAGAAALMFCLLLSAATAAYGAQSPVMAALDSLLTGRISLAHQAAGESFLSLFSRQGNDLLIDMGFVRLFYAYGIVPSIMYIGSILFLILDDWRTDNPVNFIFLIMLVLFTLVEAQQVNCDIVYSFTFIMLFDRWQRIFDNSGPIQPAQ